MIRFALACLFACGLASAQSVTWSPVPANFPLTIVSPTNGQCLTYNGTAWVNSACGTSSSVPASGVTAGTLGSGVLLSTLGQLPAQSPGTIVGNGTGSTASPTAQNLAIFTPTVLTSAGIAAAALAAYNAGGGTVVLPNSSITLTSALPVYSGVTYQGTGWAVNLTSSSTTFTGTTLIGNGTFDAFDYNAVDQGTAPTNFTTFMATSVNGAGFINLNLQNFAYGIKVGALWNMGMQFSEIKNVSCSGCGWSFWIENFIEDNFENLYSVGAINGNMWFFSSGGSALNGGNSTFRKLFGYSWGSSGVLTRGIAFGSRGASTTNAINDLFAASVQMSRANGALFSQAATMANASTSITVTNGSAYVVDLPVSVSTTANGFTTNRLYFVASVSGNTLTLSNYLGGPAIAATGSTAVNLQSYGFPQVEVVGYGANIIQPSEFLGLDCEGSGSTNLLLQNAQFVKATIGETTGGQQFSELTVRQNSNYSMVWSTMGNQVDLDSSSTSTQLFGTRGQIQGIQKQGEGLTALNGSDTRMAGATMGLYLQSYFGNGPALSVNKNTSAYEIAYGEIGFGGSQFASGATIGASGSSSSNVYTGAGGGNVTLPAIPANGDGMLLLISNPSSGTLTINTSSSQTINGSGTSYSMPANSSVVLVSANNAGTLFWSLR